jgi:hypothetical protein
MRSCHFNIGGFHRGPRTVLRPGSISEIAMVDYCRGQNIALAESGEASCTMECVDPRRECAKCRWGVRA